jgi:hypothetical protein
MCDRGCLLVVCLTAAALIATGAEAHEFSQSESTIEFDGATIRLRFSLNLLELKDVDANGDQRVSYDEIDRSIERVFAAVKEHYTLDAPEPAERIVAEKYQIADDHVLQIEIRQTFGADVSRLEVTSSLDALLGLTHQHLVTAIVDGEPWRAVLDASNRSVTFETGRVTVGRVLTVVIAALGLLALVVYRMRS